MPAHAQAGPDSSVASRTFRPGSRRDGSHDGCTETGHPLLRARGRGYETLKKSPGLSRCTLDCAPCTVGCAAEPGPFTTRPPPSPSPARGPGHRRARGGAGPRPPAGTGGSGSRRPRAEQRPLGVEDAEAAREPARAAERGSGPRVAVGGLSRRTPSRTLRRLVASLRHEGPRRDRPDAHASGAEP
jgi:hypothetical protein